MKISIVIPTYNRPTRLLQAALDSAAEQQFSERDYEVILVNDGGILSPFTWNGRCELTVLEPPHGGLSSAVNHGVHAARGECVFILPDDDLALPNKCRNLWDALPNNASVVYSLPMYVDADGIPSGKEPPQLREYMATHPVIGWEHILADHGLWVSGTTIMYRRKVWEVAGGWDETLPLAEEYEFHLRLLWYGYRFHACPIVTDGYRQHPGNKSRSGRVRGRARVAPYREYINRHRGLPQPPAPDRAG